MTKWNIPKELILQELENGQKPKEFVCLGCAAKVELVSTVYPALTELAGWLKNNTKIKLQPRDDAYLFTTGGTYEVKRSKYSVKDLIEGKTDVVTRDIKEDSPNGIVMLANFLPMPTKEKLYNTMLSFYKAAAKADHPFTVGKGHTIQIAKTPDEEYVVVDYIKSSGNKLNAVANNDTISNIDPNLKYSSWIAVYVSLNNALNDLFLCGVYKNIKIFPTFDARDPDDLPSIKRALSEYKKQFGFDIEFTEPLGFRTKSMGATVFGTTDREIPINQNLYEGQVLIATRPVGDLAPLTEYLIRQTLDEETSDLEELRLKVLSLMLTPNVEAAKIIESHLPFKGEKFNPDVHITCCRDMSGPGILAFEELAQDSMCDIYLHDVKVHDELIGNVDMPNPTSGTNGAIIIACSEKLSGQVVKELTAAGYNPWIAGKVLKKSTSPTMHINQTLDRYPFIKGVRKGIFERYQFSQPQL